MERDRRRKNTSRRGGDEGGQMALPGTLVSFFVSRTCCLCAELRDAVVCLRESQAFALKTSTDTYTEVLLLVVVESFSRHEDGEHRHHRGEAEGCGSRSVRCARERARDCPRDHEAHGCLHGDEEEGCHRDGEEGG